MRGVPPHIVLFLNYNLSLFFGNIVAPVRALAIYPLMRVTRAKDISLNSNPAGIMGKVGTNTGPDGRPDSSHEFFGRKNSYIIFPNKGRLDAMRAITLLAWVFTKGEGPIFSYGVDFSVCRQSSICMEIFQRGSQSGAVDRLRAPRVINYRSWQFVGVTYEQRTGEAKIFVDRKFVARKQLKKVLLRTNARQASMGAVGQRYFRGRISCMQVYGNALTSLQIIRRKSRCFKGKQ